MILTGRRPKKMPIDLEMVHTIAKDLKGMTLRFNSNENSLKVPTQFFIGNSLTHG